MVGWLKQLEVNFPHNSDSQTPVFQELIDAFLDLLGGDDGLHHDARVGVLLSIEMTVVDSWIKSIWNCFWFHLQLPGRNSTISNWCRGSLSPGHFLDFLTRNDLHWTIQNIITFQENYYARWPLVSFPRGEIYMKTSAIFTIFRLKISRSASAECSQRLLIFNGILII